MNFFLSILNALLFMSLFSLTKQQKAFNRTCASFNAKGRWYVYFLYEYRDSVNHECIRWDFLNYQNDKSRCIETYKDLNTTKLMHIDTCFHFDKKAVGQYVYHWTNDVYPPEHVKIISTDHSTYAIQWSCYDLPLNQSETFLYVTTRERNPKPWTSAIIKIVLQINDIDISDIRMIVQDKEICSRF